MVECYGKGIKYSLLVANSIIFLSGAVVLALGIWIVSDRSLMERMLGAKLYIASAVMLIITGTVVAVIALLGSLGAYKEVKSMLKTYFIILMALLTVILATGSLCFIFRAELDDRLQKELQASLKYYGNDSHVTESWDSMQATFECCGVTIKNNKGYESWRKETARFNQTDGPLVPESCCRSREDEQIKRACQGKQPKKEDTFIEGCYDKMKTLIRGHALTIGLAAIFSMLIIVFGLILSGTLFCMIGRRSRSKTLKVKTDEMDVQKLNMNLQNLKEQLRELMSASAKLIERNSQIDSGTRCDTSGPPPRFELLLEDFLSSCNMIELNLRTMQECLLQGRASLQNLPITLSNMKCDNPDAKTGLEPIEPNTTVSYNQYVSAIRYQVETAKAIRSILEEFSLNRHQQQQSRQTPA